MYSALPLLLVSLRGALSAPLEQQRRDVSSDVADMSSVVEPTAIATTVSAPVAISVSASLSTTLTGATPTATASTNPLSSLGGLSTVLGLLTGGFDPLSSANGALGGVSGLGSIIARAAALQDRQTSITLSASNPTPSLSVNAPLSSVLTPAELQELGDILGLPPSVVGTYTVPQLAGLIAGAGSHILPRDHLNERRQLPVGDVLGAVSGVAGALTGATSGLNGITGSGLTGRTNPVSGIIARKESDEKARGEKENRQLPDLAPVGGLSGLSAITNIPVSVLESLNPAQISSLAANPSQGLQGVQGLAGGLPISALPISTLTAILARKDHIEPLVNKLDSERRQLPDLSSIGGLAGLANITGIPESVLEGLSPAQISSLESNPAQGLAGVLPFNPLPGIFARDSKHERVHGAKDASHGRRAIEHEKGDREVLGGEERAHERAHDREKDNRAFDPNQIRAHHGPTPPRAASLSSDYDDYDYDAEEENENKHDRHHKRQLGVPAFVASALNSLTSDLPVDSVTSVLARRQTNIGSAIPDLTSSQGLALLNALSTLTGKTPAQLQALPVGEFEMLVQHFGGVGAILGAGNPLEGVSPVVVP